MKLGILAIVFATAFGLGEAQAGIYSGTWNSVAVYDGLGDASSDFDIVGDSSYPALQYAQDSSYIYLRVQVANSSLPAAPNGAYMFYIDRVGVGTPDQPNFAFALDYKSNDSANHGLEMTQFGAGTTWAGLTMNDIDGDPSAKGPADINGSSRTTDGDYYKYTGTGYGGTTRSYIEVQVAWNYLQNNSTTGLGPDQTWRLAAGTIQNATDHGTIPPNGDMLGFPDLSSTPFTGGWSLGITTVPEIPASPWFVLGFAGLIVFGGRLRSLTADWVHRKAVQHFAKKPLSGISP